jgi:hypothetical protein
MSQMHVEWLLGRLMTDRDFRKRFYHDPAALCASEAVELTAYEFTALLSLEQARIDEFAKRLDPRIVRASGIANRPLSRCAARLPEPTTGKLRRAK